MDIHGTRYTAVTNAFVDISRCNIERALNSCLMRRLLAIIVLFVLPLQWSFAAVAEYCQHETAPAAQSHLGHHDKQTVDKSGKPDKDKSGVPGDFDCPMCHHLCASAVVVDASTSFAAIGGSPQLVLHDSFPQRPPENPFRPPLVPGA